jgi:hypothetical protein
MESKFIRYKKEAVDLRRKGNTYGMIVRRLNTKIPKSTLSCWFKKVILSKDALEKLNNSISENIKKAHVAAANAKKEKRIKYLEEIKNKVSHLKKIKNSKDIAKIILAVLYLGEGSKNRRSMMLGNSDPKIIKLFLKLLRLCYSVDESKFRCTLQCRADQNIEELEKFWQKITGIRPDKFYKARIDPRTIGKKSKKLDYKGVCRIDYFSADVFNEIKIIMEIICNLGH